MEKISHALGLHMHQPPDNIRFLLDNDKWEARQIISCYARPVRYVKKFEKDAYINVGFSGILLDQLNDPLLQKDLTEICDLKDVLRQYRNTKQIEIIGMGYYHPIFPLIPQADWMDQLMLGRKKAKEIFGRYPNGFWPSEMAFSMEMIPFLRKAGYEYVIVDDVHIRYEDNDFNKGKTSIRSISYMPHIARYEDYEIVVIPRSRDISNAQESGLNPGWFENEIKHKTQSLQPPMLVTTWSDGENGGWFRQMDEEAGFWGHFFSPYMERVMAKDFPIKPVKLMDFINDYPPKDYVFIQTGAWNVGQTSGFDFSQWAGSDKQKAAMQEVWELSEEFHNIEKSLKAKINEINDPENAMDLLQKAHQLLLKSETSCYFFWGDAWIHKVYKITKPARIMLKKIAEMLQ